MCLLTYKRRRKSNSNKSICSRNAVESRAEDAGREKRSKNVGRCVSLCWSVKVKITDG